MRVCMRVWDGRVYESVGREGVYEGVGREGV